MSLTTLAETSGSALNMGSSFKRNRILNGNMLIDQRNAGASVTIASTGSFGVDRWYAVEDTAGTMTMQQSSTAPSNFTTSMVFTTGTASGALGATQAAYMGQQIEGLNVYDLGWGTVSAQSVTISFWVRSSLTGTFGGAVRNSASTRSYPFNFSISSANTWEQKSVIIAGDTSGTWLTDTNTGVRLTFGLGVGSTYSGTAGAWATTTSPGYLAPTGATSVIGTSGATFYITGVQLEVGTKATPYEMQIYSDQLAQCQRYYQTAVASYAGSAVNTIAQGAIGQFVVVMRAAPTVTWASNIRGLNFPTTAVTTFYVTATTLNLFPYRVANGTAQDSGFADNYTASAEL